MGVFRSFWEFPKVLGVFQELFRVFGVRVLESIREFLGVFESFVSIRKFLRVFRVMRVFGSFQEFLGVFKSFWKFSNVFGSFRSESS